MQQSHNFWRRRHPRLAVVVMLLGLLLLLGCQSQAAPPAPSPTPTAPVATATPRPTPTRAPPTPPPTLRPVSADYVSEHLGVDLGGVGDRALEFVDVAKTLRRWERLDAGDCPEGDDECRYAPLDAEGWPTTDARTVFFDKRPFGAWWSLDQADCPQCVDGDFQIDVSGTYKLAFQGQATLEAAEGGVDVRNQVYDEATNTTTADIVVAPEQGLLYVNFVDTRRTPQSVPGSGIADVHLMRPGYDLDSQETFTPYILEAVAPFSTLRFMNWVGGNNLNPEFAPDADVTLDWAERNPPSGRQKQGEGVAWEYVIELANLTGKNVWLNIPIHASDDYVRGMARLLHETLHREAVIYLEYSNEVWNPLFSQHAYNQAAAEAEVAAGDSNLTGDGLNLPGLWAQRRYVRRLVEISEIFRAEFGAAAINDRVRVVHSWWAREPTAYESQLRWVQETYGPPSDYFYAVAAAGYFSPAGVREVDTAEEIVARLRRSSDAHAREDRVALQGVADRYGLRHAMYEGGPDTSHELQWDRDTGLLLSFIDLHRDERIRDLVLYDLWNNWFAHPEIEGDTFIYFTLQSAYNRWGMWGLTEDITNLQTPKFQAISDLVGETQSPPPSPLNVRAQRSGDSLYLTWSPAFRAESYRVARAPHADGPYTPLAELDGMLYEDAALPAGDLYYIVVAVNAQGESAPSPPAEALAP